MVPTLSFFSVPGEIQEILLLHLRRVPRNEEIALGVMLTCSANFDANFSSLPPS